MRERRERGGGGGGGGGGEEEEREMRWGELIGAEGEREREREGGWCGLEERVQRWWGCERESTERA